MKEKEYIDKFIELCNMSCTNRDDYVSKKKIRIHNKAAKQLFAMRDEIKNTNDIAISIYSNLLKNEAVNIRIVAAAHCLNLGIHIDEAIKILKIESKRQDIDPLLSFNAEMCLKIYNGEVPGKNL